VRRCFLGNCRRLLRAQRRFPRCVAVDPAVFYSGISADAPNSTCDSRLGINAITERLCFLGWPKRKRFVLFGIFLLIWHVVDLNTAFFVLLNPFCQPLSELLVFLKRCSRSHFLPSFIYMSSSAHSPARLRVQGTVKSDSLIACRATDANYGSEAGAIKDVRLTTRCYSRIRLLIAAQNSTLRLSILTGSQLSTVSLN
jgi:hypothetical protein